MSIIKNITFKKGSVIFNWFISYFIFLIILTVSSFLLYISTADIIEKEINKANLFLLNSIQNDMDKIFEEARKIGVDALFNNRMQNVLNFKRELTDSDYYSVALLLQDLKQYPTSNKGIDNIYLMLKGIDKVVSSRGIENTYSFYKLNYSDDKEAYQTWLKEYDEDKVEKYSLVFTGQRDAQHKLLYVRALSPIDNRNLHSSITISINEDVLISQLSMIDTINQGTSFILDGNTVISSSKPIRLPDNFDLDAEKDKHIVYTEIDGQSVVVSYINSTVNNWIYVTVVPKEVFLYKLNRLKQIAYTSILVALILGLILIYFFLKANYNPINKLMDILSNEINLFEPSKNNNEYDIIEKGLKKAIADKDAFAERIENQKKLLTLSFIQKLLTGSAQSEIPVTEALDSYDLNFVSDYFSVMLFYLDEGNEETDSLDIQYSDLSFIFTNVVEELVGVRHKGYIIEVDNAMACLVNFKQDVMSTAKYDLIQAVQEAQKFIYNYFHISFTISISGIHESVDNIPVAYREVLDTMHYQKVLGIKSTMFYEDLSMASQGNFYYPIIKEQQLINIIKSGDYDNAKLILDEIYDINFKTNDITPDLAQCLMLNLVSTVIRAVNEVSPQFNDNLLEDLNPINRLLPCKSVEDMKHQMDVFLSSFCLCIKKLSKNNLHWIANDVIPYIENNYQDSNLSVSQIAEKFDLHPVYLSKAFKDTVNCGLLDYIHKLRLEKCKQFMKDNKDLSLEELSILVGFTNSRTLSRVFKKYEGVAPGKFKDAL